MCIIKGGIMIQPISAISTNSYYKKQPNFKGFPSNGGALTTNEKLAIAEALRKERNIFTSTYYTFYDTARIIAPKAVKNLEDIGSAMKTILTPYKPDPDVAEQAQKFADKSYLENANFKLLDANNIVDTTSGTIEHMTYSGDIVRIPADHLTESFDFHSLAGQKPSMEGFLAGAGVSDLGDFDFSSLPDQVPTMEGFLKIIQETVEQVADASAEL